MSKLKAFSLLTEDVIDVGPPNATLPQIAELGDFMATSRPDLVVFVEGKLPKWGPPDAEK